MPSVRLALTARDTSALDSTRALVILAAAAALLTLGACTALVVISCSRQRLLRKQLHGTRRRGSAFSWEKPARRRNMTAEDLELEAESTRAAIIRKSLASRSGRSASFATSNRSSMFGAPDTTSADHLPRYDWKDFEAAISRHTSAASLRTSTPSPMPELPAPALSRPSSPSRNPLLAARSELPPPLELHPCMRT